MTETGSLDPPPEFADLIRRQARLITRLNTKRDDWLEFTAIAAFKIGLKVLATLVVVPIILCIFEGLAWIQVAGRGKVYSAIRPVTDNLLFLGILLFAIGFLSYLLESGALIREGPRKTAWSETLVSEYISWFPSHQEIMTDLGGDRENPRMRTLGIRTKLARRNGTKTGAPRERLSNARRWALADEFVGKMSLLGQYYLAAIFATVFLWEQGLIHASQKVNLLNVIPSAASDYIWALAKLVPVIEITDTLNWTRPEALSDDRLQNLLLLTFKLALIVPIVQYITHIVRRRSESELERVINRPPFLSAVTRHKGIQYAEPDWSRVFDDAATYLNAAGVKTPEQTEWNGSRVRAALSDFYTFQP